MVDEAATRPVAGAADTAPPEALPEPVILTAAERERLLTLARIAVAVAAGARDRDELRAAIDAAPRSDRRAAAFVTLTEDGELRGCMGNLDHEAPAWSSVVDAAEWAARGDPRFPSVRRDELRRLHLDVSILGPLVPIEDPMSMRPGIDGIVVRARGRRALLLPEVADALGGGALAMLEACSRKAGLPAGAWAEPGAEVFAFRTDRFGGPLA